MEARDPLGRRIAAASPARRADRRKLTVELRHLRYFRVVAEELHFGRAAARLHMEPQPLNFQIKQLEREIGFALFSHRENRTHLTSAGIAFLADVEDLLAAADRAVEHGAQVARGESGLLRIGYVSPLVHAFLAPAVKQFRSTFPEVTFDLHTLRPDELERGLNRQELDLGFTLLPVPDENFEALVVSHARPVVAVPAGSALAERGHLSWGELDGHDAISFEYRSSGYQRRMDAMLAEHGVRLRTVQQTDNGETALALVGVGLGIALLHLLIAPAPRSDVAFVCLPDDADEAEFGAIWRREDAHPLRQRFLQTVASVARADYAPVDDFPHVYVQHDSDGVQQLSH
jgi:DNA-binding transcriptional LysR family regulator